MIGIIDYGSGNLHSIVNIYKKLNIEHVVVNNPDLLSKVDRIILAGVGSFDKTIDLFIKSGFKESLNYLVLKKKIPILGICVGMQIMADSSEEGNFKGLGWIKGKVKKFNHKLILNKLYIPHMGWNSIQIKKHSIFKNIDTRLGFYFLHSYFFESHNKSNILSKTNYGINFASSIFNKNIFGVQFHPEKSHSNGIILLKNFATNNLC